MPPVVKARVVLENVFVVAQREGEPVLVVEGLTALVLLE